MSESTDTHSEDDLSTSAEVSKLANMSKATISRAVKAGLIIPKRTPGGHFRFRRGDVETLLNTEKAS